METEATQGRTKERILNAAAEAFADYGFRGTTVRMVCAKANANVAAISYYFGSKEQLYIETYDHVFSHFGLAALEEPLKIRTAEDWEQAVYIWSYEVLRSITGPERWQKWQSRLFARERTDPSAVLPVILERVFRPLQERLDKLLLMALPSDVSPEELVVWRVSTIAQCTIYAQRQPPWDAELFPDSCDYTEWLETVAEHVAKSVTARLKFRSAAAQ